jgi:hypothetical protein
MQLGKTLVGAIIGAAVGIGVMVVAYLVGFDKVWIAIAVALLTGFGVRMAAARGNPSYLRGAITVVLALGAYFGGLAITKTVATNRAESVAKMRVTRPAADQAADPADKDATEPAAETPPPVAPPVAAAKTDQTLHRAPMSNFSPLDFIALAVAALVAYELGRGTSAASKVAMDSGAGEPMTATSQHPDA